MRQRPLKTKKTAASVEAFLESLEAGRQVECKALVRMMSQATGAPPKMWGSGIIGFGDYRFTNTAGKGSDWFVTGFSPRKRELTLYIMPGVQRYQDLLAKLGAHSTGISCLYIKRLADVDVAVLEQIVHTSVRNLRET